ncbi:type I-C CRISPR-associated protein Cas8c/Csd1 [Desulfuromonas sp. CSMB_57]|uniref:type I-C CRISPR-associated protein Cas8c/Csd1 n=1 Tax=Desulfuromonas sp. CSMB_57 TaxID=2807629 RepID=UPI001CD71D2A|nr:type I-C CRISPR-associated protein Cas8c/Csd1 [Desulfuromonas sp. CSMB_57]
MILHALNGYYERMLDTPDSGMPSFGTSIENISFALVLAEDGTLRGVEDLREPDGKKLRPRRMLVPAAEKKASGIKANFLWDATSYVLGLDDKGKQERTDRCHATFIELVKTYCDGSDPGLKAVIAFLDGGWGKDLALREDWPEICGNNLVFRLDGVPGFIHERPAARKALETCLAVRGEEELGQCLVSGLDHQPIARLHPSIKGVRNAQSSGASIVSFNLSAFGSYGKEQSFNAPVSQKSAFAYTTALNALLSRNSRQNITIGDATYVFWAACNNPVETIFADLFDPPAEDAEKAAALQDDQQTTGQIRDLLKAIRDGKKATDFLPGLDEEVQFFILGLAPNAARLSIRFWEASSLGTLLERVGKHYEQMNIVRQFDSEPEFPPLWRLLCQTASLGKPENISPVLAGGMARAVLTGSLYPQNLLPVVLERIRAEHNVTYFRAALLKAYLRRNRRMEVSVSLDLNRTDRPYLLGRLFAVLEKAQEEAIPGASATIKDRYLASAAATPGQVFHMLLKNSANHIAKLKKDPEKKGRAFHYDVMTQEIISGFSDYPKTMKAEEQGLFMIGYYHQRKDFYTKKNQEG